MFRKKKKTAVTAGRKLITITHPKSIVSEQFKTIRTNINFSMPDKKLESLLITSASPGEGKTTTASNLAVVFAQEGKKVLLIDADMRKPTIHYTFHLTNQVGLSNVLTKQATVEEAVNESPIVGLDIITCGAIPPNPAELLASKTMDALLDELKTTYDLIIFDAPPVLSVTDGQILSNKCDGVLLVISSGKTEKEGILKAKEALVSSKANVLGTVLNNFVLEKDHYYYQYYGNAE